MTEQRTFGLFLYVTLRNWRRPKGDETKNRAEDILIGEARIPNREIKRAWRASILEWLSATIGDSSKVELNLDEASSLQDGQDLLNQSCLDRIANPNETIFHTLIDSIYFLLTSSHALAEEKKAVKGGGRFDTIWYPVEEQSKRMIIVEYKYLKETENIAVEERMREAHFQIFEKGYLQAGLQRYTNLKLTYIEEVELRPVVIVEGRGDFKAILRVVQR